MFTACTKWKLYDCYCMKWSLCVSSWAFIKDYLHRIVSKRNYTIIYVPFFNSSLVNLHYTFCIFFLLFSQSVCFLLQLIKCKSYVQKLLKYIKVNMSHWSSFLLFSDNDLNCQLFSTVSCQLLTSTSPIARSFKKFHHQWEKCMATLICSRGRGFSLDPLTHF